MKRLLIITVLFSACQCPDATGYECNAQFLCPSGFVCDSTGHCATSCTAAETQCAGMCCSGDAGTPEDAGPAQDAGTRGDAGHTDAGETGDAGHRDGGPQDAGVSPQDWVTISNPAASGGGLNGIWGTLGNNVWAVGAQGVAINWNGSFWNLVPTGLPTAGCNTGETSGQCAVLRSVWGSSANNIWAVGFIINYGTPTTTTGVIMNWNGSQWTQTTPGSLDTANLLLAGVTGSSAADVWVVGTNEAQGGSATPGVAWHWNGTAWSDQSGSIEYGLTGVWEDGPDNVWAVGEGGEIYEWTCCSWSKQASGTTSRFQAVWGVNPNFVWAVGEQGTIVAWNGTVWSVLTSPTTEVITGVGGNGEDNIWVTAVDTIFFWNGLSWTAVDGPLSDNFELNGVWAQGTADVWVVGYTGAEQSSLTLNWMHP